MRKTLLPFCLMVFLFAEFSCTGVKQVSGTLSKSDGKTSSDYSRHGDYLGNASTTRRDSISAARYQPGYANAPAVSNSDSRTSDVYRKDYSRLTDAKSENSGQTTGGSSNAMQDYNQKLVSQYVEMDRLGDVILYELDIIDRRWTLLLDQFKTANGQDRESISKELDQLNANQLSLYKAYTKIYKNGKTDWSRVKSEVENTLLNLRGLDRK